jgi:alpha-galactosidase
LEADKLRFPDGFKNVSDYVHSLGLKVGIYSSAGTKTCQGLPGSLGYEEEDAKQWA